MKYETARTIVYYFMIAVIVSLSFYLIYYTKTEGSKCMTAPLVYGVKQLHSSADRPVVCSCTAGYPSEIITVTKDNITSSLPN